MEKAADSTSGRPLEYRHRSYGQVVDTILTLSTFSVGALAADAGGFSSVREGCSTVPVISTLWPTCGDSFDSSVSRRYSLELEVAAGGVVPAVPVVPLWLRDALARMNLISEELAVVSRVPLVPVGACG